MAICHAIADDGWWDRPAMHCYPLMHWSACLSDTFHWLLFPRLTSTFLDLFCRFDEFRIRLHQIIESVSVCFWHIAATYSMLRVDFYISSVLLRLLFWFWCRLVCAADCEHTCKWIIITIRHHISVYQYTRIVSFLLVIFIHVLDLFFSHILKCPTSFNFFLYHRAVRKRSAALSYV